MKLLSNAFCILVFVTSLGRCLFSAGQEGSVPTAEQYSDGITNPRSTMSRYQELAEDAFRKFQAGDLVGAAKTAGVLESSWDSGTALFRQESPDAWRAIDGTMDPFVDPLKHYDRAKPDPVTVKAAYEKYTSALSRADKPIVPDNSLDTARTPSGVTCIFLQHGQGRRPKLGDIVVLRSTGVLEDGKEFRHPPDDGSPGWYWLLPGRQPEGIIEAMGLLHVGDSAVIVIPSSLGYGPKGGFKGAIPPNAPLTYVVELLDVKSKEISSVLTETIKSGGIDAAVEQYRTLQQQDFPDVYVNEAQINGLGYNLLNEKKDSRAAIQIFQLNAQTFPNSANVYDSLGEAYAVSGQKSFAIESYKKALAIDPKKESSIQALKNLQADQNK